MRVYGCPNLEYDAMNAEEVCLSCKASDLWRVGCVLHDFPTYDFLILLEDGSDVDLRMPQAESENAFPGRERTFLSLDCLAPSCLGICTDCPNH